MHTTPKLRSVAYDRMLRWRARSLWLRLTLQETFGKSTNLIGACHSNTVFLRLQYP